MNKEIKEKMTIGKAKKILRGFLEKDCYYDIPLYYAIPYLLDYITNLQQAVKDTKENADDMLYELNEENERLKLELSGYREAILRDDKLLGLQQRIEKAVEYIKDDDNFWVVLGEDCGKPNDDLDKLLNILNGRSDE